MISFVLLRELSPRIRDQLMVSEADRVLVEARAMGVDIEAATAHPLRTMLKLDLIASSFGIAVFLLFYYASVSVLTIYWVVVFNRIHAGRRRHQRLVRRRAVRNARLLRRRLRPAPGAKASHAGRSGRARS